MKVEETQVSSAITYEGITPDEKWFKKMKSGVVDWLKKGLASAKQLLKNMKDGAVELWKSIRNGSFGKIFNQWAKDDPVGAAAGVAAAGLAAGVMLIVGGQAVGWIVGSVGSVFGKIGGIKGVLGVAGNLGNIASSVFSNVASTAYTFDFNQSDESLQEEISASIENLRSQAGEYLGDQLVNFISGERPKVEINVKALALAWALNPDARQEMLDSISEMAYTATQTLTETGLKLALLHGRRGIKSLWNQFPDAAKELIPGLDKKVQEWGEGSEPWTIQGVVENVTQKIGGEQILSAIETISSKLGFWTQADQAMQFVYN